VGEQLRQAALRLPAIVKKRPEANNALRQRCHFDVLPQRSDPRSAVAEHAKQEQRMVHVRAENQADDLAVPLRHPRGFEVQGFLVPAERFRGPRENVIGAEVAADHGICDPVG
jgi:hypothetical protein